MGTVLGVYGTNPALNGCCSENCLWFRPSEKGVTICNGPPTTVFIQFVLVEPTYTFVPYIDGKAYVRGDRVFFPNNRGGPATNGHPQVNGDGNCYTCIADNTFHIPTDTDFWVQEVVPAAFAPYLKAGAYADCLRETFKVGEEQVRLARAQLAEVEAAGALEQAIDTLSAQGHIHRYLPHAYWHVAWHYDGTIQWPTTGWCCTRPWTGNVVFPLAHVAATTTPTPPPPPMQANMIYRPEITTLLGPSDTSLQSYPTLNLPIDTLVIITIDAGQQSWRVDPGVADAGDPGQISPYDYNVVTNGKHYTRVL
jgi:hypothetical protein